MPTVRGRSLKSMWRLACALLLLLLAAACAPPNAPTSGIQGRVLAGPTCPVERVPPDPACADRPIAIALVVVDAAGRQVAGVSSRSDGSFHIDLAPGHYSVRSARTGPPFVNDTPVDVPSDRYLMLDLRADTGIR